MSLTGFLAGGIEWAIGASGYPGVFVLMLLESACMPVPSEVVMPFSGYLIYQGTFGWIEVVLASSLGNLAGSLAAYYAGRHLGRPFLLRYGRYFLMNRSHLEWAERWFAKHGDATVFISRLLPVIRTFISFPAGMGRMDLRRFSLYTFAGSVPWNLALTWVGFSLGPHWKTILEYASVLDIVIIVVAAAGIVYILRKVRTRRN